MTEHAMELKIGKAQAGDIDAVCALYDALNDHLASHVNHPGWRKGVYPSRDEADHFFGTNALYVAKLGDEVAGSLALTHEHEQDPVNGHWLVDARDDEVFVVHVFSVHPNYMRQGVGSAMLKFADELARTLGLKSIRLDVYEHNLPAIKAYERNGYQYIDTVDLGLGQYNLNWFRLYEKLVPSPDPQQTP